MAEAFISQVLNPSRLAALRRLGLLDTPTDAAFDRLSELAGRILKTPVALVTLVDDTRQFFKSCRGLPEPWSSWRESTLSYSFCQHVLVSTEPLIVTDARQDPRFADNLATRERSVVAYLGIPLILGDGLVLGSFCVIDHQPRAWTADEVSALEVLARAATTEIELRSEVRHRLELNRRLATANEDLKAFTYSVSHDLRGHLQRLQSYTELLVAENEAAPPECRDYMRALQRIERQLTLLLDGLFSLARAGSKELAPERVDLSAIAHEVIGELREAEPERRVDVVIEEGLATLGDAVLLRLVLQNLLGNAWKFTAGRALARIELKAEATDAATWFCVCDNGLGFPAEQAVDLFKPFHRLDNARGIPGSGLGLQGVKRIIDRHGGRIEAIGRPGEGACFRFTVECNEGGQDRVASVYSLVGTAPPAGIL